MKQDDSQPNLASNSNSWFLHSNVQVHLIDNMHRVQEYHYSQTLINTQHSRATHPNQSITSTKSELKWVN